MAIGLKIPLGVNNLGGASVEKSESRNTLKILELAFSEGDDRNAFQDLGIDDRLIFSIKNNAFKGRAIRAVELILTKYSELVRLEPNKGIQVDFSEEGEVTLSFSYIDLLTGNENEFRKIFSR